MRMGSFKETEAYSVLSRFPKDKGLTLVVASASNTAQAFLRCASENHISVCVVCPEARLKHAWIGGRLNECVQLIGFPGDYADAIAYADQLCKREGYVAEGGAKSIARRDGISTTVLSAYALTGDLPQHYFQAIGSGTDGIAAWEAALCLIGFGQVKNHSMKLHLVQNSPFTPTTDAWERDERSLPDLSGAEIQGKIDMALGATLTNRKPSYGIPGGVYDCVKSSGGSITRVDNRQIIQTQAMSRELEGTDICAEVGAALTGLCDMVAQQATDPNDSIMLNITGGGLDRALAENVV